ncbi:hypothetical protein NKG05_11925 [Oerskovia sp. M15]
MVDDLDDDDVFALPVAAVPGTRTPDGAAHAGADVADGGGAAGDGPPPRPSRLPRSACPPTSAPPARWGGGRARPRDRRADARRRCPRASRERPPADRARGVVGLEKPPRELWSVDIGDAWPVVAGGVFVVSSERQWSRTT